MRIVRVSHPQTEPVRLEAAKAHLGLPLDEDWQDAQVAFLVASARESAEEYCGRSFAEADFALLLEAFPAGAIALPPDVSAVASVSYRDSDGELVTLDNTVYVLRGEQQELRPVAGWPVGADVKVVFTAGPALVPQAVKAAILLGLGDLFENREGQILGTIVTENRTVKALLDPHVVRLGV